MKLTKKLLAIMLSLIMVFTMIAVPVSAAGTIAETPVVEEIVGEETKDEEAAEEESVGEFHEIFEAIRNLIEAIHNLVGGITGNLGKECPFCGEVHDSEKDSDTETPDEPKKKYNLEVSPSFGGNVNLIRDSFEAGDIIDLIATAEEGYEFKGWVSNNGGTFEDSNALSTKFTMPECNVSVIAEFDKMGAAVLTADEDAVNRAYYATVITYSNGDYADSVINKLTLPTSYGEEEQLVDISWSSSDPDVIDSEGNVTRDSEENKNIMLTATFTKGEVNISKDFTVKVIKTTDIKEEEIEDNLVTDLEDLNEDAEYELDIDYNEDETQVTNISGKYSDILVDSAETALLSISSVKSMLGLSDPSSSLICVTVNNHDEFNSYTFNQIYNDTIVSGSTITISVNNKTGEALSLSSTVVPESLLNNIDFENIIPKEDIIAEHNLESSDSCGLLIYAVDKYLYNPTLAYVLEKTDVTVYVNANTGEKISEVTSYLSNNEYTGWGKNESGEKVTFPVKKSLVSYYPYSQTDNKRNIVINGAEGNVNAMIYNSEWIDKTANSAYVNIIKVYDYYKNRFSRTSIDGNGGKISIYLHDTFILNDKHGNYYDNASNHGNYADSGVNWINKLAGWINTGVISFADNSEGYKNKCLANPEEYKNVTYASCLDVVAHEFTHGVLYESIGCKFRLSGDNRVISEAYGDIFGAFVDGNWVHGEDRHINRDMSDPESYGHADKVSSEYYGNDAYKSGGVITHAAYLMSKDLSKYDLEQIWYDSMSLGYNVNSTVYTVRRNVLQAAKNNHFSNEKLAVIRKAFDQVELFGERSNLKINILDTDGKKIDIKLGDEVNILAKSTSIPDRSLNMLTPCNPVKFDKIYPNVYTVNVKVAGYIPYVGTVEVVDKTDKTLDVVLVKSGSANITGRITSATTGAAVTDVSYKVVNGLNMTEGASIKEGITDADGRYSFVLPAGYYTLIATKEGYTTGYINITANGGESVTANASLSPTLTGNNFRVVLTWGAYPSDLDSHLFGYSDTGANYHVYYGNKNGYQADGTRIANLDVDDTTSYGPETTTFIIDATGKYEYYIDWFSGSGTWATCNGHVQVFNGGRLVYEFDAPNVNSQSGSWKVFSVENGIFKAHNSISGDIY